MSKKKSRSRKNSRASRQRKRQFASFEKLEDRRLLATTLLVEGPDIDGGSQILGKAGASDIIAFGFSIGNEFNRYPLGDGQLIEQNAGHLIVTKDYDSATPDYVRESVLGKEHATLEVDVFDPIMPIPEIHLNLMKSFVSEFSTLEAEGSDQIVEEISFSYTDLEFGFRGVDKTGQLEPEQKIAWNLSSDTTVGTPVLFDQAVTEGLSLTIDKTELAIEEFSWAAGTNCFLVVGGEMPCNVTNANDITFSRPVDKSTPALLAAAIGGNSLASSITFEDQFLFGGTDEKTTLKWTLHDPKISNFRIEIVEANGEFRNDFSIFFSKIELAHKTFDANGNVSETDTSWWDIENRASDGLGGSFVSGSELSSSAAELVDRVVFPGGGILQFDSLDWAFDNSLSFGNQGNKGSTLPGELFFTAPVRTLTPGIVETLTVSKKMDKIEVILPSVDRSIQANNAYFTNYSITGTDDPAEEPSVSFSVVFESIENTATRIGSDGTTIETAQASWDFDPTVGASKNGLPSVILASPDDQPDLLLEFTHGGTTTQIALDEISWSASHSSVPSANADPDYFYAAASSGYHSPALFEAVANRSQFSGGTAKITKHLGPAGAREVDYSWELSDFVLNHYSNSFDPSSGDGGTDDFSFAFSKVKLSSWDVLDVKGGLTETKFEWDLAFGVASGPSVIGEYPPQSKDPTNIIRFGTDNDQTLPFSSLIWGATRDLNVHGIPHADDLRVDSHSNPSTGLLNRLANGSEVGLDLNITNKSTFGGELKTVEEWKVSKESMLVTGFEFGDQAGSADASTSYSFDYGKIEAKFNSYDENTGVLTESSDFQWDRVTDSISGDTNFGDTVFEDPFPDHVLEFPNGKQISIKSFKWNTSNEVNPVVGKTPNFREHAVIRNTFDFEATSGPALAGLIDTLDTQRGRKGIELKFVSYQDDPNGGQRRPYREWTLKNVFLGQLSNINEVTVQSGFSAQADIGVIEIKTITYPDSGSRFARGGGPTVFTEFVDYISAPVPVGITDLQTHNIHDITLNLQDLFTDEQEPTEDLEYTFTVDNDPGVFISATMDANNVVTLDIDNAQTGTATITVSATDTFNNIGTKTFDVLVTDVAGFLNVTTALDVVSDTDGLTSLREALAFADSTPAADTITLPAGISMGPVISTTSPLSITAPVTIQGPGADQLTLSGQGTHRVFVIDDSTAALLNVEISGLTISNGDSTENGAGIFSAENLTLNGVVFDSNSTTAFGGGLYQNAGTLIVQNSTFSGNTASEGGGLFANAGTADINNTTFSGNAAVQWGGGLVSGSGGLTTVIRNSTFTGNRADSDGDGGGSGGAIDIFSSALTVHNSIVAGNVRGAAGSESADDISGTVVAGMSNIIGDSATSGGLVNGSDGNMVGNGGTGTLDVSTVLDTVLGDNGGPTPTHALIVGSPAIDAGNNSLAIDEIGIPLTTDQRGEGFHRFFDALGSGTASVDIGAFELDPIAPGVESVVINGGEVQRSMVREIVITFSEVVIVDSSSFMIEDLDSGVCFAPDVATEETVDGKTIATLTFSGAGIIGGSLADGNYRLTTLDTITDASGNQLDGNGDGSAGGNTTDEFFRLYGDANGSGNVNVFDLLAFRNAYNSVDGDSNFDEDLDFGGDGKINVFDLLQFRNRYGTSV